MAEQEPETELSAFSSPGANPTAWAQGRTDLEGAEVYWLSTVRPDGRPHVTPLLGAWLDGALYFCTGPNERKAKNLAENPIVSSQHDATPSTACGPGPRGSGCPRR
jgi:nitroimidazol reductase NimA-like FMN-containing flavoprotein (pyridoxamine 5'-phosphate oxidase superfamily)